MDTRTDSDLVAAYAKACDQNAFAELVARHQRMIYRICLRMLRHHQEAEDATQAVFLVLLNKASRLTRKGELTGWLYGVARNVCLEALRKRARCQEEAMMDETEVPAVEESSPNHEEVMSFLDEELAGLSGALRQAVVLRYLQNHSETEAAQRASCAVGTLSSRASRGIERLRQRLAKRGVALGGVALASLLTSESLAPVPETLLPSILATVKTAVATTATATTASSTAAMLAKGAMKAMFIAKVKTAAVSVLATVIVAGCGTIAVQELAQRKKAEQPAAAQQNEPPTKAPNGALTPIKPVVEAKPATVLGETAPNSSHAEVATTWQHVTKPVLPSAEIQLVKVGDKGELWIGMRNGLAKVEGGVLQLVAEAKNLSVWDVTPCPAGGVWIGHSAGAMLMDGVRTAHSVKGLKVSSIRMVGTQLWAIAGDESKDRNTLMLADGTDWAPEPAFKGRHVLDLIKDAKGTFWLVLDGDGVMEVDSGKPAREAKQYLRRMNVTSILSDSQGRTWCGLMSGGVMVRQNNAWKSRLEKERSAVLSLLEDSNGNIWAATSGNGIWMYDGKAWKSMLPDSDYVNLMKMTSDKRIWVSTPRHGGLRYWNGDEWKASLNCIYPVHSLVELPNGTLLAATSRDGIYVLGDFSIKLPVGQ